MRAGLVVPLRGVRVVGPGDQMVQGTVTPQAPLILQAAAGLARG